MVESLKTEEDFIQLLLENVAILATQTEPKYEKTLTPEGQEVYTIVGETKSSNRCKPTSYNRHP